MGLVVLEKFLKFFQCIFAISQLSPLEKGQVISLEESWIPFTAGCFVPSLVEIEQVVLENRIKMWKVNDSKNDKTPKKKDNGQILIRKAHLSRRLKRAKNIISFLRTVCSLFVQTWDLHQRINYVKIGWNLPSGSG